MNLKRVAICDDPSQSGGDFVVDLIAELVRGEYRLHAWKRFLSVAMTRARSGVVESSSRLATFLLWVAAGVACLAMVVLPDLERIDSALMFGFVAAWFIVATMWTMGHLSMARSVDGEIHRYFYVPNGLSYLRLALGPAMVPVLASSGEILSPGWSTVGLIFALAVTDLLDGLIARATGRTSRLGRFLDPLADIVFLFSLAMGLTVAGVLPVSLLLLIILRYPVLLLWLVVFTLSRGPIEIRPTVIGRVTSATVSAALTLMALASLVNPAWLTGEWVEWAVIFLHMPIIANLVYLLWRATQCFRERLS
jgi:cardiolipin synthase (CMP-forming)